MWYIKIRESQENTEEKTYQKYHYEVWLIEIEIDFSQRLFAAACCCASVSLKGTRCRWGLLNQKKKPRRFEEPHKIGGNKKKLRVQNLNVVINFRVANKFGEGHFVARANPDLSQTFHILGQITQKHETQEGWSATHEIDIWLDSSIPIRVYDCDKRLRDDQIFN